MFKKRYHIVYFKVKDGISCFGSVVLTIKGKFETSEVYDYIKADNDCDQLVLLNWIKL